MREKVKAHAPWYVTDFKELLKELNPSSQNGATEHVISGVNSKHYI